MGAIAISSRGIYWGECKRLLQTELMFLFDDETIDISAEKNFIWSIANKLQFFYMPDKYGNVIISITIIRLFECALEPTKANVVSQYMQNQMQSKKISESPDISSSIPENILWRNCATIRTIMRLISRHI